MGSLPKGDYRFYMRSFGKKLTWGLTVFGCAGVITFSATVSIEGSRAILRMDIGS